MPERITLSEIRNAFINAGYEWKKEYGEKLLKANRDAMVKNYEEKSGKDIPLLMKDPTYRSAVPTQPPNRLEQMMVPGAQPGGVGHAFGFQGNPEVVAGDDWFGQGVASFGNRAFPLLKPVEAEPPSTEAAKWSSALSGTAGMVGNMAATSTVMGPLAGRLAGTLPQQAAPVAQPMIQGALDFGAYNAQHPEETFRDWAGNVAEGMLMGGALGAGGAGLARMLGGKPAAVEFAARRIYDMTLMTGMALANGMSPEDALREGAAASIVFGASNAFGPGMNKINEMVKGKPEVPTADPRMLWGGRGMWDSGIITPERMKVAGDIVMAEINRNPQILLEGTKPAGRLGPGTGESPIQLEGGPSPLVPATVKSRPPAHQMPEGSRSLSDIMQNPARQERPQKEPPMLREATTEGVLVGDPYVPVPERISPSSAYIEAGMPVRESGGTPPPRPQPVDSSRPYEDFGYPFREPYTRTVPERMEAAERARWDRAGAKARTGGTTLDAFGGQQAYDILKAGRRDQVRQELKGRPLRGPAPLPQRNKNQEYAELERQSREPIKGNRTDEVLARADASGDYVQMMRDLGRTPLEGRVSPERAAEISKEVRAVAKEEGLGKGGRKQRRKKIALEETLPREWTEAVKTMREVSQGPAVGDMTDWRRQFQGIGGGDVGAKNPFNGFIRANERAHRMPDKMMSKWYDEYMSKASGLSENDLLAAGEYMVSRSRYRSLERDLEKARETGERVNEKTAEQIEAEMGAWSARAEAAMGRVENKQAATQTISEWRKLLDRDYELQNEAFGGMRASAKDVGYLPEYFPGVRKGPETFEQWAANKVEQMTKERNLSDTRPNKYFMQHHARRSNKTADYETDPRLIFKEYVRDMARGSIHEAMIHHNMKYAEYARLSGREDIAKIIENYTATAYQGRPTGGDRFIQSIMNGSPATRALLSTVEGLAQSFRGATFTLNTAWSLGTQGTSVALIGGKYPEHAAKALGLYVDPNFRALVSKLYAPVMKGRKFGRAMDVGAQGDPLVGVRVGPRGGKEKFEDVVSKLSNTVEAETGVYTAAVAYLRGKALGLRGRELTDYMSDAIAKHQSMYDRYNRANLMNSKAIAGTFPMQSFKIEAMNIIREMFGNKIGTHKEFTTREATVRLGGIIAAGLISDYVTGFLFNKDNYNATTAVPFADLIIPGKYGNETLVVDTTKNLLRAKDDIAKGRYELGASRVIRPFVRGGAQASSALQTIGSWRGAHPVEIEDGEIIRSLIGGGPYSTDSGQEHLNRVQGKANKKEPKVLYTPSGRTRSGRTRGGRTRKGRPRG